jgi:uncharacterized small protein (DUF1192 family)
MMDEEDLRPRTAGKALARDLRTLSVEDLRAYVVELRNEMERVEAEIARRQDVRGAAEALFRKSGGSGGR